jgi:hypothetical protein
VNARSVVIMMKEEAARQIEAHLQILIDYDVLDVRVGETLGEYIWSIIDKIDPVVDVDQLEDIWKGMEDGNL